MTTIDDLYICIDNVVTTDKTKLAIAINKLKHKMIEDVIPQNQESAINYSTRLTQEALEKGTLLGYEDSELVRTKRSTQHKEVIREVVNQFDLVADTCNPALGLAWNRVKKSNSILELRNNLEMYISIKDSIHQNNIQEYVDFIDMQDREIHKLKDYKRIQEELFGIVFEEDEELKLLSDIERSKMMHHLSDSEACVLFNCTRRRLQTLRKKYLLSQV